MSDHYFSRRPQSRRQEQEFSCRLRGVDYRFRTDSGVFSKDKVDRGSQILIEHMPLEVGQKVLDLGCGYGPIGIVAARLVGPTGFVCLVDVNERATSLAEQNLQLNQITNAQVRCGNGFSPIADQRFDWVLFNPPIRAGKDVIYSLVDQAPSHLVAGGTLLLVIRTRQGAKSMVAKLETIFSPVQTLVIQSGFRLLQARMC